MKTIAIFGLVLFGIFSLSFANPEDIMMIACMQKLDITYEHLMTILNSGDAKAASCFNACMMEQSGRMVNKTLNVAMIERRHSLEIAYLEKEIKMENDCVKKVSQLTNECDIVYEFGMCINQGMQQVWQEMEQLY